MKWLDRTEGLIYLGFIVSILGAIILHVIRG